MSYRKGIKRFLAQSDKLNHLDFTIVKDRMELSGILDQYSRILTIKLYNFFEHNKDVLGKKLVNELVKSFTLEEKIALSRNREYLNRYVKELNYKGELFKDKKNLVVVDNID